MFQYNAEPHAAANAMCSYLHHQWRHRNGAEAVASGTRPPESMMPTLMPEPVKPAILTVRAPTVSPTQYDSHRESQAYTGTLPEVTTAS